MDVFLGLLTLAFVAYFVFWEDFLKPLLGLDKPRQPVKSLPPLPAYKSRSRRSRRSNGVNARSAQQEAVQPPVNVQQSVQRSAPIATEIAPPSAPTDALAITPNELQQLAEALNLRAKGATIQEAIEGGFSVKKGGTRGYERAKSLFDVATQPPQPKA